MAMTKDEALLKAFRWENNEQDFDPSEGWSWEDVGVQPATLNGLVVDGLIKVVFKSNRYTKYSITDVGREIGNNLETIDKAGVEEAWETLEEDIDYDNLFSDIVGYGNIKELLTAVIQLEGQFHVLLLGPPAIAKTMFLNDIEGAMKSRAMFAIGSAMSKAGMWDKLAMDKPDVLLITELEKMAVYDIPGLLSLMEGGRIVRTKVNRELDLVIPCKVIADANRKTLLPIELLSRFSVQTLAPYNEQDFKKVVFNVLTRREGIEEQDALEIASSLVGRISDVRQAVRVARLSKLLGVRKSIELTIG